ncbi:hypothetical protein [Parabacteroides johnsonii]
MNKYTIDSNRVSKKTVGPNRFDRNIFDLCTARCKQAEQDYYH